MQGRPIYLEFSAQTNIPGLLADGVTTEDFAFAAVRQMEYLVRIKLAACQKAAGRKLDGHVVISVSLDALLHRPEPKHTTGSG